MGRGWDAATRATPVADIPAARRALRARGVLAGESLVAPGNGQEVRCPHCDKKLGDYLAGTYRTTCPRCHHEVTITR